MVLRVTHLKNFSKWQVLSNHGRPTRFCNPFIEKKNTDYHAGRMASIITLAFYILPFILSRAKIPKIKFQLNKNFAKHYLAYF